jgi:hypothetical protein
MKKIFFAILIVWMLPACNKSNEGSNPPVNKTETLPAVISSDLTLSNNTDYIMNGQVYVKNNATLTIPAGVTVSVTKNDARDNKGVLVITKGAKLIVNGTVDKPVIFTSAATTKAPGDWGGIILLGRLP